MALKKYSTLSQISFVCIRLNGQTVLFDPEMGLTGMTTLGQSGSGSNGNENLTLLISTTNSMRER